MLETKLGGDGNPPAEGRQCFANQPSFVNGPYTSAVSKR
jgi:hypothetical protein